MLNVRRYIIVTFRGILSVSGQLEHIVNVFYFPDMKNNIFFYFKLMLLSMV